MRPQIALFGLAAMAITSAAWADDKDVVARAFHTDSQYLVMNLPPRPDTWPGAIFTANLRLPIKHGDPKDPALHRGPPIGISSNEGFDLGAEAKGGWSGIFGVAANASDAADVILSFPDARIVDMDEHDLIQHVQAATDAIDAAKRGQIPLIVVKAYFGTPTVTITRKNNASAEAWEKATSNITIGASAYDSTKNSIIYKGTEEIIFAFETAQIQIDPSDLYKGKITIQFASLPAQFFAIREDYSNSQIARVLSATTGISVSDIEAHGLAGGANSNVKRVICVISPESCQ